MGKVLKVLAVVAGVAAVIASAGSLAIFGTVASASFLGVGVGTLSLIATGLSVASSLLAPRPKAPKASPENIERLNASIIPRTPRKIWFGDTAGATDIRDQEYTDNQGYLHRFIVVASHKIDSVREIWFDDKCAWTATGGAQGEYAGYLTVAVRTEGNAGNAINISTRMGSSRRFTGMAYVHLRYKLTGNDKKAESPFAQSIPSRMTIRGKGALVYDPRMDSTVPGGSGPQRANDQSTWVWSDSASRNPALQLLWWLLGWKINGLLAVGKGIPANRIDLASFAVAANLCDESVALAVGGTEPRYRSDQLFSEGDSAAVVLDSLRATMNADLDDVDGKLRLMVFHNDLSVPVATFTDDDIIDSFNWQQTPSLSDTFNIVRGAYTDASDASLYQPAEYPQVEISSPDGIDRIDSFDLPGVQSASQAQRLAKTRLQRGQYGGTFTTVLNARGWKVQKNDVVTITLSRLGWTNKLFRVAEMEHRTDGTCPITLREEHVSIYAWDADEAPSVTPTAPTIYDPLNNPIILGIGENFDKLAKLDDDAIITIDEKIRILIPNAAQLESAYQALLSIATARSISVTAINSKRTAWLNLLAAITPAWDDITEDSPVVRDSLDTALQEYQNELELLNKAVAEYTTRNVNRGAWSGSSVAYLVGDFAQRNGSSYSVITAHTSTADNGPPGANWTLLASQGAPGANGADGADGAAGAPGATGTAAINGYLTNEAAQVFAYANGGVVSYAPATGSFRVFSGTTDVSSSFALSTLSNPQGLTVGYTGQSYSVTAGFDPSEDTASLTIRATGSGSYAGVTLDKVFSLSKAKGGYEIVTALPVTGNFNGRMVFHETEGELYRFVTAGDVGWTKAVNGADIEAGTVTTNALAAGAVTAAKIGVTELSAISATIGLLRTATTGKRVEISDGLIAVYYANGVRAVALGMWDDV